MVRRLILDANALIAFERRTLDRDALADDDLAIAAVTVAEFRTGIELADTPARAASRQAVLDAVTSTIPVLDYTERTAPVHGRLLAHARRSGQQRGAHDLIIAATAIEHSRTVLSADAKARFGDLPGVIWMSPQDLRNS